MDNQKITVIRNEKFDGLEIKFPEKPPADVLAFLKSKGFRFLQRAPGPLWYTKYSEELYREMTKKFVG